MTPAQLKVIFDKMTQIERDPQAPEAQTYYEKLEGIEK